MQRKERNQDFLEVKKKELEREVDGNELTAIFDLPGLNRRQEQTRCEEGEQSEPGPKCHNLHIDESDTNLREKS